MIGHLWTTVWQGSLVIGLVWALVRLLPKLSAKTVKTLWWLASLKLLVGLAGLGPVRLPLIHPGANLEISPVRVIPAAVAQTAGAPQPALGGVASPFDWYGLFLCAYAVGLLWLAAVGIWRAYRWWQVVRAAKPLDSTEAGQILRQLSVEMGLPSPPRLAASSAVAAPLVTGLLRPLILLPRDFECTMSAEEQRMAIAHELSHVRGKDLWLAIVPLAARVLFFFLPPAILAAREWSVAAEAAADEEAVLATSSHPKDYSRLLLKIVSADAQRSAVPALGATQAFHSLQRRLVRLKTGAGGSRPLAAAWLLIPAALLTPFDLHAQNRDLNQKGNLLANPGIEAGDSGPEKWGPGIAIHGVKYEWDHGAAHSGESSLYIRKTADRYFPIAEWQQTFPYDGKHQAVRFEAWVKADKMHKAVLDVQFYSEEGIMGHEWIAYIGEEDGTIAPLTHDWKLYRGAVKVPKGTVRIGVGPQVYGPGTIWFDDARAELVDLDKTSGGQP